MNLSSYGSIFALGHKAVRDICQTPVVIQEKIDGSQISFGLLEHEGKLVLSMRSKGATIYPEAYPKDFSKAVAAIIAVQDKLMPGWVYRGEQLNKPKHGTLAYDRVPQNSGPH